MHDLSRRARALAASAGGAGLAVTRHRLSQSNVNQKRIIELAAKYRLPAIYFREDFVEQGRMVPGTQVDLDRRVHDHQSLDALGRLRSKRQAQALRRKREGIRNRQFAIGRQREEGVPVAALADEFGVSRRPWRRRGQTEPGRPVGS